MKNGMLWFDDNPNRTVKKKIERAAQRYKEKYGVVPNICYANPRTLGKKTPFQVKLKTEGGAAPKITVKQAQSLLHNHFWLGVES